MSDAMRPGRPSAERVRRHAGAYPLRHEVRDRSSLLPVGVWKGVHPEQAPVFASLFAIGDHVLRVVSEEFDATQMLAPDWEQDRTWIPCDQRGDALDLVGERDRYRDEAARLRFELNEPTTKHFVDAVMVEAAHQRQRWGTEQDAGKTPEDWFWLLGFLAGKALREDGIEKRLHRIIATAAACANWYLNASGSDSRMRPGIGVTPG